ncbi:MAG: FAD-dependent oxidoreductase [Armatimonadetes bacterium]|nr:FAD-dependent oxidoreductase [Armatimonadota bacterium]
MGPRIAVVGAGLAGLAAARSLKAGGASPVVFESASEIGGRCRSETIEGFTFDYGATSVAPLGRDLGRVMLEELPKDDLVAIPQPVMAHNGFRVQTSGVTAARTPRYTYAPGIGRLPQLLAAGLDVVTDRSVASIDPNGKDGYTVDGEPFDAVVVSVPLPIAASIVSPEGNRFALCRYRSCLSVMLGFQKAFEPPYHALVGPDQTHPLAWLSVESTKSAQRAPAGCSSFVAQMGSEYSRRRFDADDETILEETLGDVSRLLGRDFADPVVSKVVRYKYSHPETVTAFETVNSPMSRLVIAGDGIGGSRTELAFESGVRAARLLLDNL